MFKIGMYEKEITPFLGCSIRGYYNLRCVSDVKEKTYAKAVAIEKDGNAVILVLIDAACFNTDFYDAVRKRASELTNLPVDNIMVTVTHCHTGGPSFVGQFEGANDELDKTYLDWLINAVSDVATLAYMRMREGKISLAITKVEGISYVRNYLLKSGIVRTNPGRLNPEIVEPFGEPDYEVPVLFFESSDGEKLGLMYSFACHQDCVDGTEICGDYSCVVAKKMKEKFGTDFISMYFSGTAGNMNHFNVKSEKDAPDHYVKMGEKVFGEIINVLPELKEIDGEVKVVTDQRIYKTRVPEKDEVEQSRIEMSKVEIPFGVKLDAGAPVELFNALTARSAYRFSMSATNYHPVYQQVIKIGDVIIFAFAGEVFTQFGKRIRKALDNKTCFFITLANQKTFYIPPKECYLPHLYESKYASALLYPDDSEDLMNSYIDLAKKL